MQQTTFASIVWEKKGKITRRERFFAEMHAVIPWSRLLALIQPHYSKAGNGTQPKPMEQMLRIYFMQNWFNLSDPQAEDSLYDIESMRRFAGIELMGHPMRRRSCVFATCFSSSAGTKPILMKEGPLRSDAARKSCQRTIIHIVLMQAHHNSNVLHNHSP